MQLVRDDKTIVQEVKGRAAGGRPGPAMTEEAAGAAPRTGYLTWQTHTTNPGCTGLARCAMPVPIMTSTSCSLLKYGPVAVGTTDDTIDQREAKTERKHCHMHGAGGKLHSIRVVPQHMV